jgi:hypothetical protein
MLFARGASALKITEEVVGKANYPYPRAGSCRRESLGILIGYNGLWITSQDLQNSAEKAPSTGVQRIQHDGAPDCGESRAAATHVDRKVAIVSQYSCIAGPKHQGVLELLAGLFEIEYVVVGDGPG